METIRWTVGLSVSLVFGGIVTQYLARRVRKLIGDDDPQYRVLIPLSLGVVENLFFTIGIAFDLSGVMMGMVGWMGAKMAAYWGRESQEHQVKNIEDLSRKLQTFWGLIFSRWQLSYIRVICSIPCTPLIK